MRNLAVHVLEKVLEVVRRQVAAVAIRLVEVAALVACYGKTRADNGFSEIGAENDIGEVFLV